MDENKEMINLILSAEDVDFLIYQLTQRAKFCDQLATGLNPKYRASEKADFSRQADNCRLLARAMQAKLRASP